ncbi:MAG: hypothetical protein C4330_08480 [Chitinophagaceae bacterium]
MKYLIAGDYIRSGIPYSAYMMAGGKVKDNYLQRDGDNKNLSYALTAVKGPNGEVIVAPNCLQCLARPFDNKLIIGLGNTFIDFTKDSKTNLKGISMMESFLKKVAPKKYEAAASFITSSKAINPYLFTEA